MIKSIELYNWKTHGSTRLEFQKGVNLLIGIMGAGKSSVVDAISFALFGTFPALSRKRVKLEGLIKSRPSREEEATVRLSFDVGADTYVVTRKLGASGNTTARLERNGAYLQAQPVRVNEEISSLLKIDYETFSRAVYSEQNGLDYFLTITKSERKRQIDSMLGLDSFTTAEENCTSLINRIREIVADEEAVVGRMDTEAMGRQLEKLSSERKAVFDENKALESREAEEKPKLEAMKKEIGRLNSMSDKKDRLGKAIIDINGRMKAIESEMGKIVVGEPDEAKLKAELDRLVDQEKKSVMLFEELKKIEGGLLMDMSEARAALAQADRMLPERNRLLDIVKNGSEVVFAKELDKRNVEMNALINSRASAAGRAEELGRSLGELAKHMSRCPVCERELDEAMRSRLLESKSKEMEALGRKVADIDREISDVRKAINDTTLQYNEFILAKSKLKDYEGVDKTIGENREKLEKASLSYKGVVSNMEKASRNIEVLREAVRKAKNEAEALERKRRYASDIMKLSEELKKRSEEFDAIDVDKKMIEALNGSYAAQRALVSDISAKIEAGKRYIERIAAQIEDVVKQIDSVKEMRQSIDRKVGYISEMAKFKSALVETEAFLRNRLVESINGLMQGMWPELYPYSDYQRIRLSAKPDDYMLEADVGDGSSEEWVQIDSVASGGERNIACLSMRISLAMVIVPNLKWLILDEPTHNVDSNGISRLIGVLSDALPKVVEQIFIITHDDSLKQISSARIYQLDRDKSAGGSTIASQV